MNMQIIDFGLAKTQEMSTQSTGRLPSEQSVAGTLAFVAPEVFERDVKPTKLKKVDVYS